MKEYFQNKYRIPTARATWHNYREGMYFITICTHQHKPYLGRIIPRPGLEENQLKLTEVGKYADMCIHKIETLHPNVFVPSYQIMPNHIHLLIVIDDQPDVPQSHNSLTPPDDVQHQSGTPNHLHTNAPTVETSQCGVSKTPSDNVIKIPQCDTAETPQCDTTETPQCDTAETPQCDTAETPQCDVSTDNKQNIKDMHTIAQRCGLLSKLVSQFKSAITKYARERGIAFAWQTRFYDRIVRNQNELNAIVEYIENNPYK